MRVGIVQLGGQDLGDPAARRAAAAEQIAGVADVRLLMLPELWPVGFFHFDDYVAAAEDPDGPTTEFAAGVARSRACWVHGGSFVERDGADLFNSSVLVDPTGQVRLRYRKRHLFGYRSRESELLTPGSDLPTIELDALTVGAATCYDLRFPELFRSLVDAGAQCFLITSAWPAARLSHWRILARARALENLCWLVACNTAGSDDGTTMAGHSIVVDPLGEVVAEADERPQVLVADLDVDRVTECRSQFPFLADR
ncbi:MAG: carbon-nitrogen family hydrolase [Mycobacteriales bacterium]